MARHVVLFGSLASEIGYSVWRGFVNSQLHQLAVRIRDALAEIEHVQRRIQTARKVFGNVG